MLNLLAYAWGRFLGRYYQFAVPATKIVMNGERPEGPVIWVGWHATQLLGVISYHRLGWERPCRTFVAPGLVGSVVRGYVASGGLLPTPLPLKTGNPHSALRAMEDALRAGHDIVIAVDGPSGPAGQVRPGALWLARRTGCPIIPVGTAATPSITLPRWDRMILPLPGAKVAHVLGKPLQLPTKFALEDKYLQSMANALNEMTLRARLLLSG